MAKLTKRKKRFTEAVDKAKEYEFFKALDILNELCSEKLKESVDVAVNLGVDPKRSDQALRGATVLPNGTGKDVRVAVFARGEGADAARNAGADAVGFDDLADQMKAGDLNFDVVIAEQNCMRDFGPLGLGKTLGTRGLMPNAKTGTITQDVETAVKNAKSGQVRYRTDRNGIIHGCIGQAGQPPHHVKENLDALISDLKRAKPPSSKGTYLKKITLSTTMGPGITIDKASLDI